MAGEGGIKTGHKEGQVFVSLTDDSGVVLAHTVLKPRAALAHAQQVIEHADLARAEEREQQEKAG